MTVHRRRDNASYVRLPLEQADDAIITRDNAFDVLIHCANSVARIDSVGSGQSVQANILDTTLVDGVRWINVYVDVVPYR